MGVLANTSHKKDWQECNKIYKSSHPFPPPQIRPRGGLTMPKRPDVVDEFICQECPSRLHDCCSPCYEIDGRKEDFNTCVRVKTLHPRLLRLIRKREKVAYDKGYALGKIEHNYGD